MSTPERTRKLIESAVAGAIDSLRQVDPSAPAAAIAQLQEASRNTEIALNEAIAAGVVAEGLSMRQAAAASGLAPNTLPARLAATSLLGDYRDPDRRVRAGGIARARHDIREQSAAPPTEEDA
jgi:lambda repressor-like predicted transcriptional regulator